MVIGIEDFRVLAFAALRGEETETMIKASLDVA
jgi:hypothetical protein